MPEQEPYQTYGVANNLPVFYEALARRLNFPLAWENSGEADFRAWRDAARRRVMECLFAPPPEAPFAPHVLGERDMGTYVSRRVTLSITGDSRVLAYLLVPKGSGPFPAALLLHDHGARFDVGKEKVVPPWDVDEERVRASREWIERLYGGRYIGDVLARRGYVCLATDALNWSDRAGAGYVGQQALAMSMFLLGSSLAGRIAHEDLRAARFLAEQPEVDPQRIAAVGVSMGALRAWQVAALSDNVAAGIAVCEMATLHGLLVPGNNILRGQSAYTMVHPGLFNDLDHPDVASIACPKPMLFYNGLQDGLLPVASVQEAYRRMRAVWASQEVEHLLETRLWDGPHEFSVPMQEEAFAWLDGHLRGRAPGASPHRGEAAP